jgi:hypothetical protein
MTQCQENRQIRNETAVTGMKNSAMKGLERQIAARRLNQLAIDERN